MRSDAMGQRRTLALLNPLGSIPFAAWQLLTALPGQLSQARGCRYAAPSTKKIEDRKPRGTTTMNFGQAISSGFNNYVNFSGRACRSAFWYWALFAVLVAIVTQIADSIIGVPATNILAGLGLLLPGIAVSVRRLHDIDRTGWWLLLGFTIIGVIVLIYWDCVKGTGGPNRYGPDPLAL